MRILYLGNNLVGWRVLQWLKQQGEEIVGLVLHPPNRRKYGDEIVECAGLSANQIFDGSQLIWPEVLGAIKDLKPDIGVSSFFGYILRRDLLKLLPHSCINIHPAFLPYNRGTYPNIWSIIDGTLAGVTIHYIDEGVDTGDIIVQKQVPVDILDTGESLYHKLEQASVDLFQEVWPAIRTGQAPRMPQPAGGSFHLTRDVEGIDEIDLQKDYKAGALINLLRARTFPPYRGAYFWHNGRKVHLRLELSYGD